MSFIDKIKNSSISAGYPDAPLLLKMYRELLSYERSLELIDCTIADINSVLQSDEKSKSLVKLALRSAFGTKSDGSKCIDYFSEPEEWSGWHLGMLKQSEEGYNNGLSNVGFMWKIELEGCPPCFIQIDARASDISRDDDGTPALKTELVLYLNYFNRVLLSDEEKIVQALDEFKYDFLLHRGVSLDQDGIKEDLILT